MARGTGVIFFLAYMLWALPGNASTFVATQNLSFGTLIPTASSGAVIVSIGGAINTGGSVSVAPSGTGYYQGIAKFTSSGLLGSLADVITVDILTSSVVLTNSRPGGGTVTINNFVKTSGTLNVTLLTPLNVSFGGTMNFTSASKGGTYTGSFQARGTGLLSGTATATIPITLTLWNTLSIIPVNTLNFGAIERITGNSVVRINAQNSTRNVVSGVSGVNLISGSPAPTAGSFTIAGEPNVNVSIALPTSITISRSGGGSMTVNNFVGYPSSTLTNLDGSGNLTLSVGADLNIGTNQTSGTYTGTYTVTVNY